MASNAHKANTMMSNSWATPSTSTVVIAAQNVTDKSGKVKGYSWATPSTPQTASKDATSTSWATPSISIAHEKTEEQLSCIHRRVPPLKHYDGHRGVLFCQDRFGTNCFVMQLLVSY